MTNDAPSDIFIVRLSMDMEAVLPLVRMRSDMTLPSDITIGRIVRLCGDMGVRTTARHEGDIIGPPALSEYAVDPVGVDTMIPSPL